MTDKLVDKFLVDKESFKKIIEKTLFQKSLDRIEDHKKIIGGQIIKNEQNDKGKVTYEK